MENINFIEIAKCCQEKARIKQLALQSKTIKELEVTKKFLEQEVTVYKEVLDKIKSMVLDKDETAK